MYGYHGNQKNTFEDGCDTIYFDNGAGSSVGRMSAPDDERSWGLDPMPRNTKVIKMVPAAPHLALRFTL